MKLRFLLLFLLLMMSVAGFGQGRDTTVPQGTSIPGLGGLVGLNGAGYVEFGGSYFDLNRTNVSHPFVGQGGVTWTHANPGSILARSQYLAVSQGHDKEHYITVRAEIGREGYELIGPQTSLFNFAVHNYSGNWRQWLGPSWGFNMS